jgi:hypothetical protein
MAEKTGAELSHLGPSMRLPSVERWLRVGHKVEARLRLPGVVRRLASLIAGRGEAAGQRWAHMAQALMGRVGPPAANLDLPLLTPGAWLRARMARAAGLVSAAQVGAGGRAAGEERPSERGVEATVAEDFGVAASPRSEPGGVMPAGATSRPKVAWPPTLPGTPQPAGTGPVPDLMRMAVEYTPYVMPDERFRQFLSGILHMPLPAVRLHIGAAAGAAAEALDADAVTWGTDILLRSGALQSDRRRGAALVAHETVHTALAAAQAQTLAAPAAGSEPEEERLAQAAEQRALHALSRAPTPASLDMPTLAPAPVVAAAPAGAPALAHHAIRTAPTARDVAALPPEPPAPTPALTERQLRTIKDAVYRDLMNRLRLEHERGG